MSNVLHTARNIKPIKVALASGGTPSPERQAFNAAFALARAKYLAGQGPSTFPYKGALYGVDVANKPMLQGRVGQPANVPVPQARPDDLGQSFSAPTEDHAAPMQQPNNWGASGFGGDKDVSPAPQSPMATQQARPQVGDNATPLVKGSLLQRAKMHYDYLMSIGATPNEATMLTSAAAAESGFNPNLIHDSGNGYGMYGHNLGRLDMRGMSAQEQAAAALDELRNRPEGKLVNSTNDPTQLTIAQMRYERPKGWTPQAPQNGSQWGNRLAFTKQFSGFGQYADATNNVGQTPFYGNAQPNSANKNSKNPFVIGDSIAKGVLNQLGPSARGDATVGLRPDQILKKIQSMTPADFGTGPIILSTGSSNDPKNTSTAIRQIKAITDLGIPASNIKILGVGNRDDFNNLNVNGLLSNIAQKTGASFMGPLDPKNLSSDQVHPIKYGPLVEAILPQFTTPPTSANVPTPFYGDLPPTPANVPLPPVRPASFDTGDRPPPLANVPLQPVNANVPVQPNDWPNRPPPMTYGFPQVNANVPVQPDDTGDRMPPLASGVPSTPAPGTRGLSFAPAEDYEAPSFGEGITPSSYEVKPNADEAAMKAMEDDLAAREKGMGADSLWEANKDSYADGGEVDQEPITAYQGGPHSVGPEGYSNEKIGTGEGGKALPFQKIGPASENEIDNHSSAIANALSAEYGIPTRISKSKTGFGVSHYVYGGGFLSPEGEYPFTVRISDHFANRRYYQPGAYFEPLKGDKSDKFVEEAIKSAKKYGQYHGLIPRDVLPPLSKTVVHQKFGEGNVLDFDENSALVDFGKNGKRRISRSFLVQKSKGGDVSAWHPNHPLFGKAQGGEVDRNVNSLGLYSEGADIASQAKQPEQTPQQWQQYLSTRVKPDEMRWSGVGDMLASGSGKLHKDDVAEAFDHSNMNDYQENVYRGMNAPHARYQLAGPKENYREVVLQHKPEEEKFAARGHYSDSNPLLHIRMSDRPHPEGGKVLHVEELQSDWGQKGRQKGFKDQSLQKEYEDAVEKWKKANDIHWPIYEKKLEQFYHIPWHDPLHSNLIKPYEEKYNLAMEPFINAKIAAKEKLKTQKNKISPAPHVEDTNKWVDLGLKRILAEAEKGDYRGISFTSGGSQAARWNNEEGLVKPYDETIPSRMQKLMNQHDSSNQFQKYAIPFTEEDKFFSHYIPMSDKAADSIQKGQKRFKRGGYIPHHNPIVEQALNKTNIAPLDVMSLVKRSRGRP